MTAKDNPFFAKTLVNRYWKHFLGRGLVDPEDDMRATNPASNPELLEALARSFVQSNYDLKKLIRTICTATVYRLSAVPNEHNASDRQNYSRFLPKRLHAEVLLDAIDDVTLSRTSFKGVPGKTRAVQLPDNLFESYFLSVFGRPDAASACECERSGESSLAQSLHMLNSQEMASRRASGPRERARPGSRINAPARGAAARPVPDGAVARAEQGRGRSHHCSTPYIEKRGSNVQSAYEDVLWGCMINTEGSSCSTIDSQPTPPSTPLPGSDRRGY